MATKVTDAAVAAMTLPAVLDSWTITIDGLVEKPLTISIAEILRQVHVEERVYRHRCVEARVPPSLDFLPSPHLRSRPASEIRERVWCAL